MIIKINAVIWTIGACFWFLSYSNSHSNFDDCAAVVSTAVVVFLISPSKFNYD